MTKEMIDLVRDTIGRVLSEEDGDFDIEKLAVAVLQAIEKDGCVLHRYHDWKFVERNTAIGGVIQICVRCGTPYNGLLASASCEPQSQSPELTPLAPRGAEPAR